MHKDELADRETFLAGVVMKAWAYMELESVSTDTVVSMRYIHPAHVVASALPLAPHGGANAELVIWPEGGEATVTITPVTVARGIRFMREELDMVTAGLRRRVLDARLDNVSEDLSLLDCWDIVQAGVQVQLAEQAVPC